MATEHPSWLNGSKLFKHLFKKINRLNQRNTLENFSRLNVRHRRGWKREHHQYWKSSPACSNVVTAEKLPFGYLLRSLTDALGIHPSALGSSSQLDLAIMSFCPHYRL